MRLEFPNSLDSVKRVLCAVVASALYCGVLFPGDTSTVFAVDPSDVGISLRGEGMSRQGNFRFFIEPKTGLTYPISVSPDSLNWTLLTNVVGAGVPAWIEDEDAPKFNRRFYRVGAAPQPVPNMVFIGPGTFTMGSPQSEAGRSLNEGPQTVVTLTRGFWMGKYEVTQQELIALTGSNFSHFSYNSKLPLDSATWSHATNYCRMLTVKELAAGRLPAGYSYRLPTEAEWEYACRAGSSTPFGVGVGTTLNSTQANFDGGFPYGQTAQGAFVDQPIVGGYYAPNAWGLYDMHGNVREWCQDWYGLYPGGQVTDPKGPSRGTARVLRGGGYSSVGNSCRSAKRDSRSPDYIDTIQGFRLVLSANSVTE